MKKQNKCFKVISILLFILIAVFTYCYAQNNWIKVEKIKVEINQLPKELVGLKIAHISDVHLPKNAANIDSIINKVKKQKPDLIVMTGDIIDTSADLTTCGLDRLCKGLSEISKTYAVTGNHESWSRNVNKWTKILTDNAIDVIEDKIVIYTTNGKSLALTGLSDGQTYSKDQLKSIECTNNIPIILLAHRPELFSNYYSETENNKPDLIFSGHAHGGQFRIPFFNQGVVSPNQGFFPEYTSGLYVSDNNVKMIVSRGLGNSIIPVRFNNRPHLPIIELVEEE
ncbi:metallophosphoesterase [Oceanirhabdus sp. W0125-5]|uniref:metallophosphoesterase n=1 Tax=Oceanirhabdus sp. W0125-5 TaxID=2999116 RepID=UPI0022F2DB14|nr:metallophosphoesterase [Oceanirhabdus sp. W0125-5]WBW97021.1 metallophosphoesterase [Oceanirhabdus sp. W0125-5]